jgi:signal transduction histidine kinase
MQEMKRLNHHLHEQGRDLALRNQEVEAFVYIVSHDLRAPLVNIQGFCFELEYSCEALEKLLDQTALPDDAKAPIQEIVLQEIPDSLRFIKAGTARFEQLINALLRLSRTGRQTYRYDTVDMAEIVGEVVDSLTKNLEQVGASVVVSALPAAVVDRVAIGQVFSNLTVNALNYLRPDVAGQIEIGGELDTETGNPHFWVRDNGLGIPEAVQERVFQVFQRAHPEQCDGEGMGLAIVKRIVERHGGEIWLESEVGHGSTFHFTVSQTHLEPSLSLSEELANNGA